MESLRKVRDEILACRRCPRLVAWREEAAANPPKRFVGQKYHARPVPGFGDSNASILVVGLAPAAHGGNRTGRVFTGDRSGDWLFGALHRAGLANQPTSESADDGLELFGVYVTAVCRCAPPANKPTPEEAANCSEYLDRELEILWPNLRAIVVLGSFALSGILSALNRRGIAIPKPRPRFGHGNEVDLSGASPRIIMSFHPSQQNTFTGKLTRPMFDSIWVKAKATANRGATRENRRRER